MAYSYIRFETGDGGVALLTVNRPEKLNALNRGVLDELDDALTQVESSGEIRGLILTGAGEKAFVAGADIGELARLSPVEARAQSARGQRLFRRLETLAKPTLAAINGFALGGGLELAMSCTLRLASETARLGQPEVKLGILAGYGGTQRLPRLVGRGKAMEMLLTGEPIDAREAHRIGLVNQVVLPRELIPASQSLMAKILANAPLAVALSMEAVDTAFETELSHGLRLEAAAFGLAAASEDAREGLAAFVEKRPANFKGR